MAPSHLVSGRGEDQPKGRRTISSHDVAEEMDA
jgi:hypothetical protein